VDAGHLVLLEQELDPLGVRVDHLLLAVLRPGQVEVGGGDVDPEDRGALDLVQDRGGVEQRLGGDAAAQAAGAAQLHVFLDDRGLQA